MSWYGCKRSHQGSGDAFYMGEIEEIIAKIVSRLPANSVLKCKLVSKFWHQLIREPHFPQLQFSSAPKDWKLLFQLCGDDPKTRNDLYLMDKYGKVNHYVTLPFPDPYCSLQVVSAFNGLICCAGFTRSGNLDIKICNPTTQDVLQVPAGQPSAITPTVGIVFDPDKNKYKVLRFFDDAFGSPAINCKCEIYTPGGEGWRTISGDLQWPSSNPTCRLFPTYVSVGGRMYWKVWSKEDADILDHICSIDIDGNLSKLQLPKVDLNLVIYLVDCKGRLALVCVDNSQTHVDVWTLTNPIESSWVLEGSAKLLRHRVITEISSIVSIGNELLFSFKPHCEAYFRREFLNLDTMTWRTPDYRRFRIGRNKPVVFTFSESLFPCDAAN